MKWDFPVVVEIDGKEYKIRNNCDYKVVLDCIAALNDNDLEMKYRIECALFIFYEDSSELIDLEKAVREMFRIINYGEEEQETPDNKPQLMNWEKDFRHIAPPVNHVLGYDVRIPDKYTHWWTFLGGYMEIGESTFSTIVSIRNKKAKNKKLDAWEEEFYRENRKMIDLPLNLTAEEQELLNSDW